MDEKPIPVVAVTGAGGFVGREVAARLLAGGFRIRALRSGHGGGPAPEGVETADLPAPEASAEAFATALRGATHLVHAAALNNADRRLGDAAYSGPNAELTGKLAGVAAAGLEGRMVFLSSIRAMAGPLFSGTLREDAEPAPSDAYGRSKREGERLALDAYGERRDLAVLRLPPVYGLGMGGNLAALLRLARSPWPLPLVGLAGRRSLLDRERAAQAVLHLLTVPAIPAPVMLASDAEALTPTEIVSAFRAGLGRPARLIPVPGGLAGALARLAGKGDAWRAINVAQICAPGALAASGWVPAADSRPGLSRAAAQDR